MTQVLIDSKITIFQQNPHFIITIQVSQNPHFVVTVDISQNPHFKIIVEVKESTVYNNS
jgi:hypothetical protein